MGVEGGELSSSECRAAAKVLQYKQWCHRGDRCFVYMGSECGCREPNAGEIDSSCPNVVDDAIAMVEQASAPALAVDSTDAVQTTLTQVGGVPTSHKDIAYGAAMGAIVGGAAAFAAARAWGHAKQNLLLNDVA